ncbi:probable carbohydrate esterase At4g34215 [Cucurbita maxima]|uniref:Probable carbohydrate esterase At4g34215 n=1 Tax=Cucurbita maxima TaxID=3661 RepID=A0A6J1I887_CUCMA|nr:probable carbohydrate esterase At4g34215 [Cucurbita maxima]
MAGGGGVEKTPKGELVWDGKVPSECQSDPFILRLNPERQWEIAHEPLHLGIDVGKTKLQGLVREYHKEGGVVRALFWYQGESDAAMNDTAQRYKDNLKKFITDIRNDIKLRFLPVIIVKISLYDFFMKHDTHNLPAVRAAEDAVQKELPDIITIDSWELPINFTTFEGFSWDHGHFNTETEIVLGKWLADTYLAHYGHLL